MRFSDKAFEKAYLRIIKESAGFDDPEAVEGDAEVCPDCGEQISYDEEGNPICGCTAGMEECDDAEECDDCEEDEDEEDDDVEECDDCEEDEDEEDDDLEECDDCEEDEDEEDEDEEDDDLEEDEDEEDDDAEDVPADDAAADAEEVPAEDGAEDAPAEGGKFISFYTTDQGLIDALQNGFATIAITPVAEDDQEAEAVEFAPELFENLTVEDLKDEEGAEGAEGDDTEVPADDVEGAEGADAEVPAEDDAAAPAAKPAKK